jgi:antitoxin component of RelBE/YafQ-DinJ toxin-antitoxin module
MLGVPRPPKKTSQIILRLDPELDRQFRNAINSSGMSIAEALRAAAEAMVTAHRKHGRIPKDMEIRQDHIGDLLDVNELLGRVQAVAEAQALYTTNNKKPPKPASREASTGPVALVSDRPA